MAVAITRTADPAGVAADGSNNSTYTNASIGTASDDRIVVVAIGKEVTTTTISGVTIGGVAAAQISGTTFNNMGAWLYYLAVTAGTTATIVVSWNGAISATANHIAVYTITDGIYPATTSGSNSSTDMDASTPLTSGSVTVPANGGMLAIAAGATDGTAKTWANITEDLDEDAGDFRFTTASMITAGTITATCTGGTNNEDGALAWAIFSQAIMPAQLITMPPYRPR